MRARCRYWGCSVDPFSQFRGNCAHFGEPSHPQSACVPCFCFCNVFCHVRLLVGLLVSKFHGRIMSPCLNNSMSLSWLHAGVLVLYTRSTGKTVLATVLAPSACGEFVAIRYEVDGRVVEHPRAPAPRIHVHGPSPTNEETRPETIRK